MLNNTPAFPPEPINDDQLVNLILYPAVVGRKLVFLEVLLQDMDVEFVLVPDGRNKVPGWVEAVFCAGTVVL